MFGGKCRANSGTGRSLLREAVPDALALLDERTVQAYIDERRSSGPQSVPDLSASIGLTREGARYRTVFEFLYGQGRFTGYRSLGLNVAFSARGWFGRGGGG